MADSLHAKMMANSPLMNACKDSVGFIHLLASKLSVGLVKIPGEVLFFQGDAYAEDTAALVFIRKGGLRLVLGKLWFGLFFAIFLDFIYELCMRIYCKFTCGMYINKLLLYIHFKYYYL